MSPIGLRMEAAKAALPYEKPRLASIETRVVNEFERMSDAELDAEIARRMPVVAATGIGVRAWLAQRRALSKRDQDGAEEKASRPARNNKSACEADHTSSEPRPISSSFAPAVAGTGALWRAPCREQT
jgi:hypothetical protein